MKTIATRHSSRASALILFFMVAVTRAQIQTINIGSTSGGDTGDVGGTKINNNFAYVETQLGSNTASIASLTTNLAAVTAIATNTATNMVFTATGTAYTNAPALTLTGVTNLTAYYNMVIPAGAPGAAGSPGTNGLSPTISVGTVTTGAAGSAVVVTNVGSSTVMVLNFAIPQGSNGPAGPAGTNTVTVMNFSNQVLSSQQILAYSTNNIVWGTSNYVGTVPGFYTVAFNGGQLGVGGISPTVTNVTQNLYGSTNGDVSWFLICSNGGVSTFTSTNPVDLSVSGAGGGLGSLQVYYVDHPELIGRTNGHFGQVDLYDDPTQAQQGATKNYVDTAIASANASLFQASTDTNNVKHYSYSAGGSTIFDMANQQVFIGLGFSVSGTNLIVKAAQTNLTAGYTMQMSTNLTLSPNNGFTTFTNILGFSTNSGIVSFTNAIKSSIPTAFYRILSSSSSSSSSSAFYVPVSLPYVVFGTNSNYPTLTVTHSTNSTFGYGAGLIACDTNYIYVSVGTNAWNRISISTNTW